MEDELWARIVIDLACAQHEPLERSHLLRSLTPLYLARVASFVIETRDMFAEQVENRIEQLCLTFEQLKPYLESRWGAEADRKSAAEPEIAPSPDARTRDSGNGGPVMIPVFRKSSKKRWRALHNLTTYLPPLIVAATILAVTFLIARLVRWIILRAVKALTLEGSCVTAD